VSGRDEREYLTPIIGEANLSEIMSLGVDFSRFRIIDYKEARKELGLDPEKKYIIYVGKFYPLKGVDLIIKTFNQLKSKYNVGLILIGGHIEDPLYKEALDAGAIIHLREEEAPVNLYYCAADVCMMLVFNTFNFLRFGGTGIAPLEAMACGTPVVSFSLRHFPKNDVDKVGLIPDSVENISDCVSKIFDNPSQFAECSQIVRKYYDWEIIANDIINSYKHLMPNFHPDKGR
jgi:glycosyltransferase involved in cell wall biosynthesis